MLAGDAALTAPTNASADASPIARRQRSFLININFEAERPRIAGILATADVNDRRKPRMDANPREFIVGFGL